jgi:hypothetical protein
LFSPCSHEIVNAPVSALLIFILPDWFSPPPPAPHTFSAVVQTVRNGVFLRDAATAAARGQPGRGSTSRYVCVFRFFWGGGGVGGVLALAFGGSYVMSQNFFSSLGPLSFLTVFFARLHDVSLFPSISLSQSPHCATIAFRITCVSRR